MEMQIGDKVELCYNEPGFYNTYFEGKVVRRVGKDKLLVEFDHMVREDDESKKLREVMDVTDVRPLPPAVRVRGFNLLDVVDAYADDVWWLGRITSVHPGNYFGVYFESTGEEHVYLADKLRIHQEYQDGRWVTGCKSSTKRSMVPSVHRKQPV